MSSDYEYLTLEEILRKTSLLKYIEQNWQPAKKLGSEYKSLCPFHDDKNPSMSINDDKGVYFCYSCKAGGNLITFIKEYKNFSSEEALDEISNFFNLRIKKIKFQNDNNTDKKNILLKLNSSVAELFHKFLLKKSESRIALDYLQSRGFNLKDIEENQIGFAPNSWDFLTSFVKNNKEKLICLEELGLIKQKEDSKKYFDFFRNRIIFPIKNRQGLILAFAGRTIDNSNPKYLNSKESVIFSKRKALYGIDKFNNFKGKKPKFIFIVEGYTDVLMMNKVGIYNVVASMGTSLTFEHTNEIKKFADKVILNFDSDDAGLEASFKSIEPLFDNKLDVYTLNLPLKQDPCEFIKESGKDEFLKLVKNSSSIIDYFIDYSKEQYLNKEKSINSIIEDFSDKISNVGDVFNKDLMINKFISAFGISKNELQNKMITKNEKDINNEDKNNKSLDALEMALKILLENKQLRDNNIINELKGLSKNLELELLDLISNNNSFEPSDIINIANNEVSSYITEIIFSNTQIDSNEKKKIKLLNDCLIKCKLDDYKEKRRRINMKLNQKENINESTEMELLKELKKIIEEEKKLKS